MENLRSRREFLANIGKGALLASVGAGTAHAMRFAPSRLEDGPATLSFGAIEPLVCLMQETPLDRLLPALVEQLKGRTDVRRLVAAAALANARTFGGEDYIGFHTMMALSPARHMAAEMPVELQALPVLKVLYRNTSRIQAVGGRRKEVLRPVAPQDGGRADGEALRERVRQKDVEGAERMFAAIAKSSPDDAFNALLVEVQDNAEIHRTALPYRAWDLLDIVGKEHAHTMLRQSLRYCLESEKGQRNDWWDRPRTLLPKIFDELKLDGRTPGSRQVDDAWIDRMSQTLFTSSGDQAALAAAEALADGIAPDAVGEALSLAANQILLRSPGRTAYEESAGKPMGSVHGDSRGLHASDSANAWRNMARVSNARNTFACLILGAYQAASDHGGLYKTSEPLPLGASINRLSAKDPDGLLREAEESIKGNLQARACAAVHQYLELGQPARPVFDLLLKYAVSEDGALHAEKYYRTVSEEYATTRPAFRNRHLVALARVTASEYGRAAAGVAEARQLLKA
jgi:hypothetical protein